jgi:uncharacterized RDD family membrane protein YckC
MNWYYAVQGKQMGPISDADLEESVRTGSITDDTMVWHEGLPQWTKYGEVRQGGGGTAVAVIDSAQCAECHGSFSEDAMVNFGGTLVCAQCKPRYVQKLKEGVHVGTGLAYASFGRRFGAKFLDGILFQVVNIALAFGLGMTMADEHIASLVSTFVGMFFNIGVSIFCLGKWGATPGKLLLKLQVVRPDGAPLTYGRATGRFFAEWVSSLTLLIGYLMAKWDSESRALHDRIADTRVIQK